jgi:hypothetical protein
MKYACLVYHEQKGTPPSETELAAIVAECRNAAAGNAEITRGGHHVFTAGLQSIRTAKTARKRDGKLVLTDGPFAETKECLGGFTIIEARDLREAVQLASKFASGMVTIEVRPVLDADAELTDPIDQQVAAAVRRQTGA